MKPLRVPVSRDDHRDGPLDAPVVLVEYGGYQCPFSAEAALEVKRLKAMLQGRLLYVFRHFPLTPAYPHAMQAAEAAEAAGQQGRFWPMHEALLENQADLDLPALVERARALGLDVDRFAADLERHAHQDRIRRHFMGGIRSGVNGTPIFFVNGYRHDGPATYHRLLASIHGAPCLFGA